MERQTDRRELGREAFVERVWAWKEESGGTISQPAQAPRRLLRLVARALHHGRGPVARRAQGLRRPLQQGLIYQDKRLVNWDPKFQTAISDLEVAAGRGQGQPLAHPLPDRGRAGPLHHRRDHAARDDAGRHRRRRASRGRALPRPRRQACAILPLVGRRIPIVADEYSDPEKGTGAVKITPGARLQRFRGRPAAQAAARSTSSTPRRSSQLDGNEAFLDGSPAPAISTRSWRSTASTASRRASAIVALLEERGFARRRSSRTRTRCRTATARAW